MIDPSLATEVKDVVAGVTKLARESPNAHNFEMELTITQKASDALMAEHGALVAEAKKQIGELADQLFGLLFSAVRPRKLQRIWSRQRQTLPPHTLWRR